MIADARLAQPIARIISVCANAEDLNWPLTSHDGGGSSGKPGSRDPGRQQSPWLLDELGRILTNAARKAEAAYEAARVRERGASEVPSSVAGQAIEIPPPQGEWEDLAAQELRAKGARFGSAQPRQTDGRFGRGADTTRSAENLRGIIGG